MGNLVVNTGRTYELADDNTLSSVDDEGTGLGHKREITHKYLMNLDNVFVFFIMKPYLDFKRCRICRITFLAFLDSVLNVISAELEVDKFKTQLSVIIFDGRNIPEYLMKTFSKEPIIRILLNLNKVRHLQNFLLPRVTHSYALTDLDRTYPVFFHHRCVTPWIIMIKNLLAIV